MAFRPRGTDTGGLVRAVSARQQASPSAPLAGHVVPRAILPRRCVVPARHRDADVRARTAEGSPSSAPQSSAETEERASASLKTALVHASPRRVPPRRRHAVDVAASNAAEAAARNQPLVGPPLTLRTNELLGEAHSEGGTRPRRRGRLRARPRDRRPTASVGAARPGASPGGRRRPDRARRRTTSSCWLELAAGPTRTWPRSPRRAAGRRGRWGLTPSSLARGSEPLVQGESRAQLPRPRP